MFFHCILTSDFPTTTLASPVIVPGSFNLGRPLLVAAYVSFSILSSDYLCAAYYYENPVHPWVTYLLNLWTKGI